MSVSANTLVGQSTHFVRHLKKCIIWTLSSAKNHTKYFSRIDIVDGNHEKYFEGKANKNETFVISWENEAIELNFGADIDGNISS